MRRSSAATGLGTADQRGELKVAKQIAKKVAARTYDSSSYKQVEMLVKRDRNSGQLKITSKGHQFVEKTAPNPNRTYR